MSATVRTSPVKWQQAKRLIVVALLALSMTTGIAGTTTHVSAAKRQPKVVCTHYTMLQWYALEGEDVGPAGYWDCNFAY